MPIYSPSSREDFSFCPRMWYLRKHGWTLRRVTYPELCGIGGSAVSEAMYKWNMARMNHAPMTLEELIATGLQAVTVKLAELASLDRRVTGLKDVEFMDALPKYVETGIRILWTFDPLKDHTILGAEVEYPQAGHARLDVVSRTPVGEMVVDDYKCKFGEFDEKWLEKEFDKHFDGEQRLTYTAITGATLFGIILVLIRPTKQHKPMRPAVIRRVSRVKPEEHAVWKNDAALDYAEMERVLQQPSPWQVRGKAAPHANSYGDCVYREACCEDLLDEGKMKVRYIKIEKESANDAGNNR